MGEKEKKIFEIVYEENNFLKESYYEIDYLSYKDKYNFIKDVLIKIKNLGCDSYNFISEITHLEEKYGLEITDVLYNILNYYIIYNEENNKEKKDIAFTAFYTLVVTYYRYNDVQKTKEILKTYHNEFNQSEYILLNELYTRYCLMTNNVYFGKLAAITCVKEYQKKYNNQLSDALKVTYVSAICATLELMYIKKIAKDEDKLIIDITETIINDKDIQKEMEVILSHNEKNVFLTTVCESEISKAYNYIEDAIKVNSKYSKYHYLKAQLLYYSKELGIGNIYDPETVSIKEVLLKAKSALDLNKQNKNYIILKDRYDRFRKMIEKKNIYYNLLHSKKQQVLISTTTSNFKDILKPKNFKNNKIFVSYSYKDYKSVYCDILELQERGVRLDYDIDLVPNKESYDYKKRQEWYKMVEEKIATSDCVICYISENYVSSASVLREIKLIDKYKKPTIVVDLSGKNIISEIIKDVIENEEESTYVTSDSLYWFTKTFSDNTSVIRRGHVSDTAHHIDVLMERISTLYPLIIDDIDVKMHTYNSTNLNKNGVNEDAALFDEENKIFVVTDGVTRTDEEYKSKKYHAREVSTIFAKKFIENMRDNLFTVNNTNQMNKIMKDAFDFANKCVKEYNDDNKFYLNPKKEIPGCVGVVATIYKDILFYGYFGDCNILLVRNNSLIVLSSAQTALPFELLKLDDNREILIEKFINKNKSHGYGIVNGDEKALDFFKINHISLEKGDIIYLISDGLSKYMLNVNPEEYCNEKGFNKIVIDSYILERYLQKCNNKKIDEETLKKYDEENTLLYDYNNDQLENLLSKINEFAIDNRVYLDDRSIIKITYGNNCYNK